MVPLDAPLYFIRIARGVMLRGTPIGVLWQPLVLLGALSVVVFGLAVLRFRRELAPAVHHSSAKPGHRRSRAMAAR